MPSRSSASSDSLLATVQSKASKKARAIRPLRRQLVRHVVAVGVVGREQLGPVGGGVGPEAEDDRSRLVNFDLAEDQVGGAEQRVDRLPVGADDRFRQRVEGAEQHRGGVDREERSAHSKHPRGCASVSRDGSRADAPDQAWIAPPDRPRQRWDRQIAGHRHRRPPAAHLHHPRPPPGAVPALALVRRGADAGRQAAAEGHRAGDPPRRPQHRLRVRVGPSRADRPARRARAPRRSTGSATAPRRRAGRRGVRSCSAPSTSFTWRAKSGTRSGSGCRPSSTRSS